MTSKLSIRDFSMVIALTAIWGFFSFMDPTFLTARNLSNLAVELSITAVLSLGMLLIIVPGHIDLSIGSGVGLLGGLAAVLIHHHHWPAPMAMLAAAVIAVIVWLLMGTAIVTQKIPAFIITLAGLLAFKGLHWKVIDNTTVPVTAGDTSNAMSMLTTWCVPAMGGYALATAGTLAMAYGMWQGRKRRASFGFELEPLDVALAKLFIGGQLLFLFVIVCNQFRGVPLSAIILAITAIAVWVLTQHTRFGRYLYAIGGNEEAAVISGIPVRRVVVASFGIMGLIVALGGFMQTAYPGSSTTTVGQLLELDAIAACVIGGTSLRGGRGTVAGVLFGSLIMASLTNGMFLLSVAPETTYITRGVVLALAVWMDVKLAKN